MSPELLDAACEHETLYWKGALRAILHPEEGTCAVCEGPVPWFPDRNYKWGFPKFCSTACSALDENTLAKRQATTYARYGATHFMQTKEGQAKAIAIHAAKSKKEKQQQKDRHSETMIARYGSLAPESIQKKRRETFLKKYGVENPMQLEEVQQKAAATHMKRYGVTQPLQNEQTKAKARQTTKARYGKENVSQVPSIRSKMSKSAFSTKAYRIGGRTFYLQGYESHLLKHLIEDGVSVAEIVHGEDKVPTIPYIFEGKRHIYYPDFYMKLNGQWTLVEVKSAWTLGAAGSKRRNQMKAKVIAAMKKGYPIIVYVVDARKGKITKMKPLPLVEPRV